MNRLILLFLVSFSSYLSFAQISPVDHLKIKEDLNEILNDLSENYTYLQSKGVDLDCIKSYYSTKIESIKTEEESVLFFEYLLDEFYDSHLILNTNRSSSFRLYAPIYVTMLDKNPIISNIWFNQIEPLKEEIIGARVVKINNVDFDQAILDFPTHCNDKNDSTVREWVSNKLIAGRYNQPRILTLVLKNGKTIDFDLDKLTIQSDSQLLTTDLKENIGYIRINNSLGDNNLITKFDQALNELMQTKGLIIDLRNTVGGGNSYVARGIMSRFISKTLPYQKHEYEEHYDDGPSINRSWLELVTPRGETYTKPVVILVGRWTGSMGEGLAIGMEGLNRGVIMGTEMERLAGEMNGFSFLHRSYGYRISNAKLFHVNNSPREQYVPSNYVKQTSILKDETLTKAMNFLKNL